MVISIIIIRRRIIESLGGRLVGKLLREHGLLQKGVPRLDRIWLCYTSLSLVLSLLLSLLLVVVVVSFTNTPVCKHDRPLTNSVHEAFTNTKRSHVNRRHHEPFTNHSQTSRTRADVGRERQEEAEKKEERGKEHREEKYRCL